MKRKMTRRDFLNGTQIAIGAALLSPSFQSCQFDEENFNLPKGYYPPTKLGMRGSHDGSWETMHEQVTGKTWKQPSRSEHYDLVIE